MFPFGKKKQTTEATATPQGVVVVTNPEDARKAAALAEVEEKHRRCVQHSDVPSYAGFCLGTFQSLDLIAHLS